MRKVELLPTRDSEGGYGPASLPFVILPLCHMNISCCSSSELQLSALAFYHRAASLPSWIQLSAICRGGQSGKVIDLYWQDVACLPLGHPSAASGACAVVQISSSKQQCGKRQARRKAALLTILSHYQLPKVLPRLRSFISSVVLPDPHSRGKIAG